MDRGWSSHQLAKQSVELEGVLRSAKKGRKGEVRGTAEGITDTDGLGPLQ